jgi:predicted ATP-dependent endonuclease of OLD family
MPHFGFTVASIRRSVFGHKANMKLSAFRIQNYRSVIDSGWIDTGDISVIVGKNESGKTSVLKALWKFNPFHSTQYDIDREWPRGRRKEKSLDKVVSTVRFQLEKEEISLIEGIHESAKGITGVEIQRNYKGSYLYTFLPKSPASEHPIEWVVSLLQRKIEVLPNGFTDHFKNQYTPAVIKLIEEIRTLGSNHALVKLPDFKNKYAAFVYPNFPQNQTDNQNIPELNKIFDRVIAEIKATPSRQVVDTLHEKLPTFIYMDDYKIFRGAAQLDEIKKRKDSKKLTSDDETLIQIMEMAGLDLDEEVEKGNAEDKEQRMLDLNDASLSLTTEIAERWSQKKYEVRFEADGQHFITFVKDVAATALVPLEERSKGFQWFFSFDMTFMYETKGNFSNSVILLDEPGLHLHAAAQGDLLKRMKSYAKNNQLIYSTHLPFMIDFTRLDNIFISEETPKEGVKVHKNWAQADKDARFTLQAALGLSWSQSLFVGQYNLIVEGVTDFWFLITISTMLREAGQEGIDESLVITPAGGASKVAYVGTILLGQKLNVAVLLDSDSEGKSAYEHLVKQWLVDAKFVLQIGTVLGVAEQRTLEDCFDEKFYLKFVAEAYKKELGGQPLAVGNDKTKTIIQRIEEALKAKGIENYNKGRTAKLIMSELSKKKIGDLPNDTVENFKKIISAVNGIVASWKNPASKK